MQNSLLIFMFSHGSLSSSIKNKIPLLAFLMLTFHDTITEIFQARSHNEANEAVASPKISKKNLPQMKNS